MKYNYMVKKGQGTVNMITVKTLALQLIDNWKIQDKIMPERQ